MPIYLGYTQIFFFKFQMGNLIYLIGDQAIMSIKLKVNWSTYDKHPQGFGILTQNSQFSFHWNPKSKH